MTEQGHMEDALRETTRENRVNARNYGFLGAFTIAAAIAVGMAAAYAATPAAMIGLGVLSGLLGATGLLTSGFSMVMEKKLAEEERSLNTMDMPYVGHDQSLVMNAAERVGQKDWQQRVDKGCGSCGHDHGR